MLLPVVGMAQAVTATEIHRSLREVLRESIEVLRHEDLHDLGSQGAA